MKKQKQTNRQCLQESLNFLVNCGPVIPNLRYAYPQGYETGHLGVRKKQLNSGGKGLFIYSYNI